MTDPFREGFRMKREIANAEAQLALILPPPSFNGRAKRIARPCSQARARWWFDEMRRVVDAGLEVRATGVR